MDGVGHLEIGPGRIFVHHSVLNGDIQLRENFVCCPDYDFTLIFAESIADLVDMLYKGYVEGEAWGGETAKFAEGADNSSFHGRYEAKHVEIHSITKYLSGSNHTQSFN